MPVSNIHWQQHHPGRKLCLKLSRLWWKRCQNDGNFNNGWDPKLYNIPTIFMYRYSIQISLEANGQKVKMVNFISSCKSRIERLTSVAELSSRPFCTHLTWHFISLHIYTCICICICICIYYIHFSLGTYWEDFFSPICSHLTWNSTQCIFNH